MEEPGGLQSTGSQRVRQTERLHFHFQPDLIKQGLPCGSDGKVSVYNVEDLGSIPGSGRSPGEGNGNPLKYSSLENSMDGEVW